MALFSESRWFGENQGTAINGCPLSQVADIKFEMNDEDNLPNIHEESLSDCYSKKKRSNAEIEYQLDFIEK